MKYKVIVADPPWKLNNYSKPAHGAPQYPKMTYDELQRLPVETWADKNCLLVMWCIWSCLDQGVELLKEWGFEYVTGWPWIKTVPSSGEIVTGMGFWAQATSEFILIGRKGKVSPPKKSKHLGLLIGDDRIFYAPARKKHSKKPENIQDWLEINFSGPYLEIFATRERAGWDCWGHDTGYRLTPAGVERLEKNDILLPKES